MQYGSDARQSAPVSRELVQKQLLLIQGGDPATAAGTVKPIEKAGNTVGVPAKGAVDAKLNLHVT
jgi:hypothetical protein